MSPTLFQSLLRDLTRLGGAQRIDLVGLGEPLLHPDFLHMAAAVKESGLFLCLSTNGSLLDEEKARRLVDLGVDSINVSINAGSDEVYEQVHPTAPSGARQQILDSLRAMTSYRDVAGLPGPVLTLSTVLFKQTYRDLIALVRSAAAVGARHVQLIALGTVPETEPLALERQEWQEARQIMQAADELAREFGLTTSAPELLPAEPCHLSRQIYAQLPCYVGHTFAGVFADGQVRFCCGCDRSLGNITEQPFRRIWRGRAYARLRRMALDLPRTRTPLPHCNCFQACPHQSQNIVTHRALYPDWSPG
jgi:MoaA/NifB/PqqE/SkfB family radical SAM enzyme